MLISRCTDPRNLALVGLPPKDLMSEVQNAWAAAGYNAADCWKRTMLLSNEWVYDEGLGITPQQRIRERNTSEKRILLRHRAVANRLRLAALPLGDVLHEVELRRDHAGGRLGGAALLHRLPHLLSGQLLRGVHRGIASDHAARRRRGQGQDRHSSELARELRRGVDQLRLLPSVAATRSFASAILERTQASRLPSHT